MTQTERWRWADIYRLCRIVPYGTVAATHVAKSLRDDAVNLWRVP